MPSVVESVAEKRRLPTTYKEIIDAKVAMLEKNKSALMKFDEMGVTQAVAVVSAVVLNVSLKRSLLLYEGAITTGFLTGLVSAISNYGLYYLTKHRLLTDPTLCSACAGIRGGVVQGTTSSVVPLAASFAAAAIVADRYGSVDIPSFTWRNRSEFVKFWSKAMKPLKSIFFISFGLQSAFGFYYAYRRKLIVDELHASVTPEEFASIMSAQLREVDLFRRYSR